MNAGPTTAHELTEQAEQIAADQPLVPMPSLAASLVAALADLTVVEAARTATVPMKTGGSYSYKYADIADAVKVTRPVLAKHGIVALTPVHAHGPDLACTVILLHTSGDRMDLGPFPFERGRDAQATGSMVTYHRRYSLIAALGMAAGDDDDGAAAKAGPRNSAPAGPSAEAVDALAALDDLPNDVADKLAADLVARAGAETALAALEDEGWRKWFSEAIAHHKEQIA